MPNAPDDQTRPFAATLQDIGGGKLAARLTSQLADVTAAVTATGKKGSITLKIEVSPVKGAAQGTLTVAGTAVARVPEETAPTSIFFADDSGNLTRDDPRQPQLPLRGLPTRKEATA